MLFLSRCAIILHLSVFFDQAKRLSSATGWNLFSQRHTSAREIWLVFFCRATRTLRHVACLFGTSVRWGPGESIKKEEFEKRANLALTAISYCSLFKFKQKINRFANWYLLSCSCYDFNNIDKRSIVCVCIRAFFFDFQAEGKVDIEERENA